ncbi:MAG: OmpA family protein, partial [Candidatus Omnitrophota bacterium]
AVRALKKNPQADILITGNCDIRGPEAYNLKLGRQRAEAVKRYMIEKGIADSRIRIVSRGKLDAVAPITDLVGMQKDRNAQFMVAEVEEIMLPAPEEIPPSAKPIDETKFLEEERKVLEGEIRVSTREYTVKKGDTLWKIAQEQLGSGHRWKYLYELNKERIKDPSRLKPGLKIIIPVE